LSTQEPFFRDRDASLAFDVCIRNYRDEGDFVFTLTKLSGRTYKLSVHTNDPYQYTLNNYVQSPVDVLDGQWHDMELFLDWSGQEDSDGGSCVPGSSDLRYNSTDGNGIILFRVDGVTVFEKTNTCFYFDPVDGPPLRYVGWPSNRSGSGGSGSQIIWMDDLEIWDDLPDSGDDQPDSGDDQPDDGDDQPDSGDAQTDSADDQPDSAAYSCFLSASMHETR
jgi:hypothetical protein